MKNVCLFLIRAYQQVLGPLLGGSCRFYPSCSHYAGEAIERHGAGRGASLAMLRFLRCHPFSPGGVDLVPEEYERAARGASEEEPTVSPEGSGALTPPRRATRYGPEPAQPPQEDFAR